MRASRVRRIATAAVLFSMLTGLAGCWFHRSECPACPKTQLVELAPCGSDITAIDRLFDKASSTQPPAILFLSGGGSYGAWGAGVLYGWAETGQRPAFQMITGASTGALLGAFAILGGPSVGEMDEKMKDVYTKSENDDIFHKRFLLSIPFSNSLRTLDPLHKLVRRTFTPAAVQRIGEIYENEGRQFWIGTTNLDTGQFCNWNMGEIAAQGQYDRFIDLMIASCANPGVFNPQFVDGSLHADGGVRHQIYGKVIEHAALSYDWYVKKMGIVPRPDRAPKAYAIVNGAMDVRRQCVTNEIVPVVLRATAILTADALEGDLYKAKSKLDHATPAWEMMTSIIPQDYALWPSSDHFFPDEMLELFERGETAGKDMNHWIAGIPRRGESPAPCLPP